MKGTTQKETERDQVEELLRAAEDELLLDLSVDGHMSRVSPAYLDPDLDRRFRTLKSSRRPFSSPSKKAAPRPQTPPPSAQKDGPVRPQGDADDDEYDLFARFAALKGSLPSASFSTSSIVHESNLHSKTSERFFQSHQPSSQLDDDTDEDEVEKVIQWAKDAACLDPSPPTDDEDEFGDDDSDVEDRVDADNRTNRK